MEISIKKPCHENWNDMTPNEQGAFCGKCVKTVVDFSNKSLEEIKSFFTGREQEKVCGRFEERQLTALSFDAFFKQFKRFEFTKRLAVILFFTFGVWLFGASSASAQSNGHIKGDVKVQEPKLNGNVKATPAGEERINCIKANPGAVKMMGTTTPTAQPQTKPEPQSYKMGKVAPVKQVPGKDPVKQTPVKQKPEKEPMKMGEVIAPKEKAAPKK